MSAPQSAFRVVRNVEAFISRYCFVGARHDPLTLEEFQRSLSQIMPSPHSRIGVAVSGGPDSMALLALATRLLGADKVVALTISHGPEKEGGEPISMISELVQSIGVKNHRIIQLSLKDPLPSMRPGRIQQVCRDARYGAIRDEALKERLELVLSGHHLDDDLCTFFMRLTRYSGIEGLGGMRPLISLPGTPMKNSSEAALLLGRPLLRYPKGRLVAACQEMGVAFIEDASNGIEKDSLRNMARDGIQTIVREKVVAIQELYDMFFFVKRIREELRLQVHGVISKDLFEAFKGGPFHKSESPSGNATLALNLRDHWWKNPGLLMRVLSVAVEGVSGRALQSSHLTLFKYAEALAASALIRSRQFQRRRFAPQHSAPPFFYSRMLLDGEVSVAASQVSGQYDGLRRLPFIRNYAFGRCILSPIGSFEARNRGLACAAGPVLLITASIRMPLPGQAIVDADRRMVDDLLITSGHSYLWDERILLSIDSSQFYYHPVERLKETSVEKTKAGPLTSILSRSGGIPQISIGQRTFQDTPMLWIRSPALGPEGRSSSPICEEKSVFSDTTEKSSSDDATKKRRIRIVPLTLPALRWLAAGALKRGEEEGVRVMESIRKCHTADSLPQHPLVIGMDGTWASFPSLNFSIGNSPFRIRAVPAGMSQLLNRIQLPSILRE